MRNVLAVVEKEFHTYFSSPMAYVITAGFLVIGGIFFAAPIVLQPGAVASMRVFFSNMPIFFLLITPALTMRLLAEEQRVGTIEILLTAPVRDVEVVVGKYLAALGFMLAMLLPTLYYPFLLISYGGNPDRGPILAGYLGTILLGAAFLSIGLLASSLTQNQVVAAVASFAVLLGLWLIGILQQLSSGWLGSVLGYLSVIDHFNEFPRGIIDTKNVVYYLSLIVAFLFLTVRSLESRRWR